jgi:hypothetical protein
LAFTETRLSKTAIYSRGPGHHEDVITLRPFFEHAATLFTMNSMHGVFAATQDAVAIFYSRTQSSILFHKNVIENEA